VTVTEIAGPWTMSLPTDREGEVQRLRAAVAAARDELAELAGWAER